MKALLILVLGAAVAYGARYHEARQEYQKTVRAYANLVKNNNALYEEALLQAKRFNGKPQAVPRPSVTHCQVETSPSNPTSVDRIRPSDVRVLATMGDSITAGNGVEADTIIDVAFQNRGRSWCIGGEESFTDGVVTLTNMIRHFNPDVEGYSMGDNTGVDDPEAGLNVAIPGDVAEGMPAQADDLVEKLRNGDDWDFDNDWKIITLLIGGNDLCRSCYDRDHYSPANWRARLESALDILHRDVPRAIVFLHPMFDISPLYQMSDNIICDGFQMAVCYCGVAEEERENVRQLVGEYNRELDDLVSSGKYNKADFTVVLQVHTWDAKPPMLPDGSDVDRSYWSPDCFHPGTKGHYALATSLWNSMLEPVGQKRRNVTWEIGGTNMKCPTASNPYIFTPGNSGGGSQLEVLARRELHRGYIAELAAAPGQTIDQPEAGLSAGGIVGITLGAVMAALLATVVIVAVVKYIRKRKTPSQPATVDNPAFDNKA